jgi:hypothetical protein
MERFAADADAPVSAALDSLATRMGLGLLLVTPAGGVLFSNAAARHLLGCADSDSLAERWHALQAVKIDGPAAGTPGSRAFTADLPVGGAVHFLRGEVVPCAGGSEIFLKDRRSLGELDIELLCASRMREWIHQCEALVHDANGAMNTIQLTLELLDGQWPGQLADEQSREPHRRKHIGVIRDNLEKLKATLRKFVAAHEAGPAGSSFDLREVLNDAASTLRMPARRRRIDLQVVAGDAPLPVNGNRARIRQAVVNVALSRMESLAERGRLMLEALGSPHGAEIVIRDDGALGESARAGIFRILVPESGAGSGEDALRLARAMVECEAGEVQVDEAPGLGTRFRFRFSRSAT